MTDDTVNQEIDYYTWGDTFWYLFGYNRDLEITPCIKQVGKRHLLQKQIKNNTSFKLKKVSVDKRSNSVTFETEYPLGKIITLPKKPKMWSEVGRKKKKVNKFSLLE